MAIDFDTSSACNVLIEECDFPNSKRYLELSLHNMPSKKNSYEKKPNSKSMETRMRILDSAARVFRQQGYSARLEDIAEAAGVTTGSLYYHFKGRDDLVEEVLRLGIHTLHSNLKKVLAALPEDATPLDRLRAAIRSDATMALETSDYSAAGNRIFPVLTSDIRERSYALHKEHGNLFHSLFAEAQASGHLRPDLDLPTIRMLIFGAMNWTAEWYRPNRGRSAQSVIDHVVNMAFDGILAKPK
ncbi:TetR family transcriptional regulator [Porticoccaceae bacterium]|nr:TetR family transcriptional regulator [Porticoccaceae bacterium]